MHAVASRDIKRMKSDILSYILNLPVCRTKKKVSEYAALKRRLNTGPRQGPYDPKYTPYLIEPMDNCSVGSTVERTIFVKSVQIGATTAMENIGCYYIDEDPSDVMFTSGTDALLKRWVQDKFDPAIDAFGLRHKIRTFSESGSTSKQSGDTIFRKCFDGCSFDMVSARSSAGQSQISKKVLLRDEIDRAPKELTTGEGNFLRVTEGRTQAFGNRRKIFDASTPTTATSLIWSEYLTGDQRLFFVPCPHCGELQALEFGDDYTNFGLKGEFNEDGILIDCYYLCKYCNKKIYEYNKTKMLSLGRWIPTAVSQKDNVRSYSINSLYGPLGMSSWRSIYIDWKNSINDPSEYVTFRNLYMGLPSDGGSESIDSDDLIKNIESIIPDDRYSHSTVPNGTLFLTAACDVQLGSEIVKSNPARIEMEILGHGKYYKTWSIDYVIFKGGVKDAYSGAWQKLYKFCVDTNLEFKDSIGAIFPVRVTFVDSGEGKYAHVVYEFCKRLHNFYASKGFRDLQKRKNEKFFADVRSPIDKLKYRKTKVGADNNLIEIATTHYKDILYNNLKKKREKGSIQKPGFCDFPVEYIDSETKEIRYGKKYFDQLTAATKLEDGSYTTSGKQHEALDVRVYNLAAADFFTDVWVEKIRNAAYQKYKQRIPRNQIDEQIRTPVVLKKLEEGIERQRILLTKKSHSGNTDN